MTTANIIGVMHLATPVDQMTGITWYADAQAMCKVIADEVGIDWHVAAGVVAALSPNNRWERNCTDAETVARLYKAGGADHAKLAKVCTYKANLAKAIAILGGADIEETLHGPKTIEFYRCITGQDDVCIDGHAYCVWFGQRLTMHKVPTIGKKLRAQIKADYKAAAEALGLKPYEVQAITWCAWRRIHNV